MSVLMAVLGLHLIGCAPAKGAGGVSSLPAITNDYLNLPDLSVHRKGLTSDEWHHWLFASAKTNNRAAQCHLGERYFVREEYEEARGVLQRSALQGEPAAAALLGYMYYRGKAPDPNSTLTVGWFLFAARKGNTFAQLCLGAMYGMGTHLPENPVEAYRWVYTAARKGDPAVIAELTLFAKGLSPQQISLAKLLAESPLVDRDAYMGLEIVGDSYFTTSVRNAVDLLAECSHETFTQLTNGVERIEEAPINTAWFESEPVAIFLTAGHTTNSVSWCASVIAHELWHRNLGDRCGVRKRECREYQYEVLKSGRAPQTELDFQQRAIEKVSGDSP